MLWGYGGQWTFRCPGPTSLELILTLELRYNVLLTTSDLTPGIVTTTWRRCCCPRTPASQGTLACCPPPWRRRGSRESEGPQSWLKTSCNKDNVCIFKYLTTLEIIVEHIFVTQFFTTFKRSAFGMWQNYKVLCCCELVIMYQSSVVFIFSSAILLKIKIELFVSVFNLYMCYQI